MLSYLTAMTSKITIGEIAFVTGRLTPACVSDQREAPLLDTSWHLNLNGIEVVQIRLDEMVCLDRL